MQRKNRKVHEDYHQNSLLSKRVVKENAFTYRHLLLIIKRYLKNNSTIIDIGCGVGTISFYCASKGHHVMGIDISQKAVNVSRRTAKKLNLLNAAFLRVDFPNESNFKKKFDLAIFSEVIEHIENDRKALKEINKLLKRNGILILSTPSIHAPLYRLGLTKNFDREVGHLRRYSLNQLQRLLQDANFEIEETKRNEGIIRNFLFINPIAGKFIRFIKFFLSDWITYIDNISLRLFGESNYIIVARKKK